jgi:cytochrome P450
MDDAELPGEPRFDPAIGAWVLSRFADVSAALADPRFSVSGASADVHADADADADAPTVAVRHAATESLSPMRLASWRADLSASARALIECLPTDEPLDLIGTFARPWSVALAEKGTGARPTDAERLARLARDIFLAAAHATTSGFPPGSQAAVAELASLFPGAGASAQVQAYVAISQTLPCLLARAWLELLRHPAEASRLRSQPDLVPKSIDELLRHASPSRAILRRAAAEASIGPARIAPGERVILMLAAANHDPARFPDPNRLDLARDAAGHLAFGRGPHSCPGAPLIRIAICVATDALLRATSSLELVSEPDWIRGFAIRAPATLPVVLRRESLDSPLAK